VIEGGARVVVQGATGREARMVVRHMLAYGTPVAAGVTPGRGGEQVEGVPVHDSVEAAVRAVGPVAASLVSVPPAATLDAACEALAAGVGLLVVATENVPRLDAARLLARAREHGATVVGPNSVGLIRPDVRMKIGAIGGDDPDRAFAAGPVAVISRSGGLTVETALGLRLAGLGVSTAVSVGGDAIIGTPPAALAVRLAADPATRAIVVVGEPGTRHELDLAEAIAAGRIGVPVVVHVPGRFMEDFPQGMRFGHAGAVIGGEDERPGAKLDALAAAGALVAETYGDVVPLVRDALARDRVPPPATDAAPIAAGSPAGRAPGGR
jgi:succinyl-CoA synthetase alpha subunit